MEIRPSIFNATLAGLQLDFIAVSPMTSKCEELSTASRLGLASEAITCSILRSLLYVYLNMYVFFKLVHHFE